MGFNNPHIRWSQIEQVLSGRAPVSPTPVTTPDSSPYDVAHGPQRPPDARRARRRLHVRYAELHAHSSYSFLDGVSSPAQLVEQAAALGLTALALTDHDGFYGAPQLAEAAEGTDVATVFGAELNLDGTPPRTASARATSARSATEDPTGRHLLVLARDPHGYASLAKAISLAQLRGGSKGHPAYDLDELTDLADGHWLILTGCRKGSVNAALERSSSGVFALDPARAALADLADRFGRGNVAVELTYATDPTGDERYDALATLAAEAHLPLVATTGAHYHTPDMSRLATAMAAIRARRTIPDLAGWMPPWGAQLMRSPDEMAERFARYPHAVPTSADLADECAFPLRLVAPDLPPFPVPAGFTGEMDYLRHLVADGMIRRYGPRGSDNDAAYRQAEHELGLIERLHFPGYFLIVWEITEFCRNRRILYQGRGSAANSVVCYALGITAANPIRYHLLFERFLSAERGEPPDIDVDIESGRREEVIQHLYEMHDRHHCAQVANVITYRPRSAIRDAARALGYSPGQQDAWSKSVERRHGRHRGAGGHGADGHGADGKDEAVAGGEAIPLQVRELAVQIAELPRHLGIHSGGMVMCDRPVIEVCPVEHARMDGRTVLQWDKEGCAAAGLVKFDLLGLGMLTALRHTFDFVEAWHGVTLDLHTIPADDEQVFEMISRADTIGVFQIESRAQQSVLPRLRPRAFYDLVIQIALIRPGPIQGGAVHPYLRRRDGKEKVTYPHPSLEPILGRTLGVPLFQEQLMAVAVQAAGFTPGEADELRRAMGHKRSHAKMAELRERLYQGMARHGIVGESADLIYRQIEAFASYGFPESHSISFAYLANASAWLKLHHPAEFLAGLLGAQPMGFYSPQSLVHDARRHGVVVRGPDVNRSGIDAVLEPAGGDRHGRAGHDGVDCAALPPDAWPAVRLGLSSIRGIGEDVAGTIVAARAADGPFTSMADLAGRIGVDTAGMEALAAAGAFTGMGLARREALWEAAAAAQRRPGRLDVTADSSIPRLPVMTASEEVIADLQSVGVSRDHPIGLMRADLTERGVRSAADLARVPDRTRIIVAGIVTHRQRPPTAGGITFLSLEDETGQVNVVVPQVVWERHGHVARTSTALAIRGMLERSGAEADRDEDVVMGERDSGEGARDIGEGVRETGSDPRGAGSDALGATDVHNVVAERVEALPLTGVRSMSRDFQ